MVATLVQRGSITRLLSVVALATWLGPSPGSALTATPTATPTAARPPLTSCTGDCDGSRIVTIDEVLTCLSVALGDFPSFVCTACDPNLDGLTTVDELQASLASALSGC